MAHRFNHLVFAGTFDHFHVGHQKMLCHAFELARHVSLGIATEKLYSAKTLDCLIEPLAKRKKAVEQYLSKNNFRERSKIILLSDIFGPSITDKPRVDAILVTKNTKNNAKMINKVRQSNNLKPLKIITCPFFLADDEKEISSERIRLGEISSSGHAYAQSFDLAATLSLPQSLREDLRKPLGKINDGKTLGKIIKNIQAPMIIAVGDIVSSSLLKIGIDPSIKIIDNKTRREAVQHKERELTINNRHDFINHSGTINLEFIKIFRELRDNFINNNKPQLLVVLGEEDLLTLPAVLLAPLDSLVLYGHFQFGVVWVKVTEQKKKQVENIMKKFKYF